MAGFYHTFTSLRTTEPDQATLLSNLRSLDNTAGVNHDIGTQLYIIKKSTDWTSLQVNAAQNVIDTTIPQTNQTIAQAQIDQFPIATRALILALIDQLNVIRAALPSPLPPITPTQAIAAIRAKAGTL